MDAWQYFWHRYFHTNRFLYKHIHSVHHRLYVPYACGALYNHPIEGLVLDSIGGLVAHVASRMTIRQACFLFVISTLKTVDDHCGLALPWDPLQLIFANNADCASVGSASSLSDQTTTSTTSISVSRPTFPSHSECIFQSPPSNRTI